MQTTAATAASPRPRAALLRRVAGLPPRAASSVSTARLSNRRCAVSSLNFKRSGDSVSAPPRLGLSLWASVSLYRSTPATLLRGPPPARAEAGGAAAAPDGGYPPSNKRPDVLREIVEVFIAIAATAASLSRSLLALPSKALAHPGGPVGLATETWKDLSLPGRIAAALVTVYASLSLALSAAAFIGGLSSWLPLWLNCPTEALVYTLQSALSEPLAVKFSLVLLMTLPVWAASGWLYQKVAGHSMSDSLWQAFIVVFQCEASDDTGAIQRLVVACLAIVGSLITGVLLGVVVSDVENAAEQVVSGNNVIVEAGHTVVLGWTKETIPLLRQLAIAQREGSECGRVVVLGSADRDEMEGAVEDIRNAFPNFKVITRQGDPTQRSDLERVAAGTAAKIIFLVDKADETEPADQVHRIITTGWSLRSMRPAWRVGRDMGVVIELPDCLTESQTRRVVQSMERTSHAGGVKMTIVDGKTDLGRLVAQSATQPGLYDVLSTVMQQDRNSAEFYVCEHSDVTGRTYGDVRRDRGPTAAWAHGIVVGMYEEGAETPVWLNLPDDYVCRRGQRVIMFADKLEESLYDKVFKPIRAAQSKIETAVMRRGDAAYRKIGKGAGSRTGGRAVGIPGVNITTAQMPKRVALLGVTAQTPSLVQSLNVWAAPGSHITVVGGNPPKISTPKNRQPLAVTMLPDADPSSIDDLASAGVLDADVVIVDVNGIADSDDDTGTVASLVALTDLAALQGRDKLPHVVAICHHVDAADTVRHIVDNLALSSPASLDVVHPDAMPSGLLAQVTRQPSLRHVFNRLLTAEGAEIFLTTPDSVGLDLGVTVTFDDVQDSCRQAGVTCLGVVAPDGREYGLSASAMASRPIRFRPGDRLAVIGEYVV